MIDPKQNSRRLFIKSTLGAGYLAAMAGSASVTWSSAAFSQSAEGYEVLRTPMPTDDSNSIEVLEFFWFGCPHCYAFEPAINKWDKSKPDYVSFVREAPPLNPSWEQHSRAFYAAEAFGINEGFFDQMFDRIHKDRKPMRNPKNIAQFVERLELGVSADKFQKAMKSFAVDTAIKRSISKAQAAGINGVPSIIVNGKYRTGNSIAGSHQGIINAINKLVEIEHNA
ncbi:MAG: thiol:disulfide interchange protein DsbA/DsbL [Gammaproteobacteria bacterium]|nr:thiol:disulfide interchange protein DsbA/DsbL [Gammaproteobacteria bacterium]